jgi:MarR family transcriptional regulator, organic hydroperoxide resistance regulator
VRILLTKEGKLKREKAREKVLKFNEVVRSSISTQDLNIFFEVIQQITQLIEKNVIYEKE